MSADSLRLRHRVINFDSVWDCALVKAPFLERVSISTALDVTDNVI